MSSFSDTEKNFHDTLALLVLEGFQGIEGYKHGWLEGYARAYTQITGKTIWQLIDTVNKMLVGSGRQLKVGVQPAIQDPTVTYAVEIPELDLFGINDTRAQVEKENAAEIAKRLTPSN